MPPMMSKRPFWLPEQEKQVAEDSRSKGTTRDTAVRQTLTDEEIALNEPVVDTVEFKARAILASSQHFPLFSVGRPE